VPTDAQILAAGTADAPLDYGVPNAQEILLKAVNANFDGSAAAGDFLPAVVIESDGGVVIARAIGQAVTAGDSAEVSFFPRVAGTSAAASGTLSGYQVTTQNAAVSIPSGVETLMTFNRGEYDPGDVDLFGAGGFLANPLLWINPGIAVVTVSLTMQAGGTSRYLRLRTIDQMSYIDTDVYAQPVTTPVGDLVTATTQAQGNATGTGASGGHPTQLAVYVFQNSGSGKLVSGTMTIAMLPSDGLRHP